MLVNVYTIICDEMIDPVIDTLLEQRDMTVYRPKPAETDEAVLGLADRREAPILTRDTDFVEAHRDGTQHFGILYDRGMHHRPAGEIVSALESVFELMNADDLRNTVVRLNRFY